MTRRRKILILGPVLALAVVALLLHFKQRDTYKCSSCHSKRHVYQWRLGIWHSWSVPLSTGWEDIECSQLHQGLFPDDHQCAWTYFQGSPYHFFGTRWGGCAIGSSRHINRFCQWYEMNSDFRKMVQAKIEQGQVTKETLQQIAGLPPWHSADSNAEAEEAELIELAKRLIEEAGY